MNASIFILTINVFTASAFSACFAITYLHGQCKRGEKWFSIAYALIAVRGLLEFAQPFVRAEEPGNYIVFLVYLAAMIVLIGGLSRRFARPASLPILLGLFAAGMGVYLLVLGLDRDHPLRPFLYQAPFVLVQLTGCWIIGRARRSPADSLLLLAFAASAAIFAVEPVLAHVLGIGRNTQLFLESDYDAFSQTFEAFFLISTGILLVVVVTSDLLAEVTLRSETDKLSSLHNRRGFEEGCGRMLAEAQISNMQLVLILADLDHFKSINDRFGHATGDRVIVAFSRLLRSSMPAANKGIIGRLGGEEFGILLSGNVIDGRNLADSVRRAFAEARFDDLGSHESFTASFGIAECMSGETMLELMERADTALYAAKKDGRNRLRVAHAMAIFGQARPMAG